MKTKYYFVRNINGFTTEDVVYTVFIGTSRRELSKLELIKCYAHDCGMYFKPVDQDSRQTIMNLANSLFKGAALPMMYLRTTAVSAGELYDMIINDSFVKFESELCCTRPWFFLMGLLDPHSSFYRPAISYCNTTCPTKRKYLSHKSQEGIIDTLIKIGLILAAFLCSGYLEGIEKYAY